MKKKIIICTGAAILLLASLYAVWKMALNPVAQLSRQLKAGDMYYAENKYNDAILTYNKVLKIYPQNIPASIGLAKSYAAINKLDEAEVLLKEIMTVNPESNDACIELARLYESQHRFVEGVHLLDQRYEKVQDDNIKKLSKKLKSKAEEFGLLENGGFVIDGYTALFKNNVYYCSNDGLYKCSSDGSKPVQISDGYRVPLKIIGDWIYYSENNPDYEGAPEEENLQSAKCFRIGKMKLDGSKKTILVENVDNFMQIHEDYIYYRDKTDKQLYKFNIVSYQKFKLTTNFSKNINEIFMDKDGLYFNNDGIYKLSLDGSILTKLLDDVFYVSDLRDGWIYYINQGRFFRIDTEGKNQIQLGNKQGYFIGNDDEYIYYMNQPSLDWVGFELCRITSSGTGTSTLARHNDPNGKCSIVTAKFYKGNIYYINSLSNNADELYKLNPVTGKKVLIKQFNYLIRPHICAVGDCLYLYDDGEEESIYPQMILTLNINNTPSSLSLVNPSETAYEETVGIKRVTTSSQLIEKNTTYKPEYLVDGNKQTPWVEGTNGDGIGEWVMLEFNRTCSIIKIDIINGFAKSDDLYYANNRVKKIQLEFSDGIIVEKELEDGILTFQTLTFDQKVKASWVKLTILEVYTGSKYQNTCISEIGINQ